MGFGGITGNCIGDSAYIQAAERQSSAIIKQAAADVAIQIGVALWQRNASSSITNMQEQLADQQMELAEEVHAHAVLFWPEERELVNDVFAEARTEANYAGLPLIFGSLADETMDAARTVWIDTMRQLCMSPSRCQDARWQRNAIASEVDLSSYGARQEEARAQISNDRRYARQLAVLGLGRGRTADLVSYQSVSQYSGLSASAILESGINSALTMYGYESARREAPTGWGVGIRDSWSQSPRMPGTVNGTESGWNGQPLPGMIQTQTRVVAETTKETESDWAFGGPQ